MIRGVWFLLVCTITLSGCIQQAASLDAGGDGAVVDAGPRRDPDNLFQECTIADGCEGADELCTPIHGVGRDSATCTYACRSDSDCPTPGFCLGVRGSIDNPPRCREMCTTDADCRAATFGCYRTPITSTAGMFEVDLCFPD